MLQFRHVCPVSSSGCCCSRSFRHVMLSCGCYVTPSRRVPVDTWSVLYNAYPLFAFRERVAQGHGTMQRQMQRPASRLDFDRINLAHKEKATIVSRSCLLCAFIDLKQPIGKKTEQRRKCVHPFLFVAFPQLSCKGLVLLVPDCFSFFH